MSQPTVHDIARRRWRIAVGIGALMFVQFFGYVLFLTFARDAANALLMPGLTVGIVLGMGVVVVACGVTVLYVRWANSLDSDIERLGRDPS